jgi:hypothetical protein
MHGKGSLYLKQLLETIEAQKGVEFSVLISDQSSDESIKNVCSSYSFVKRLPFTGEKKASSNLNNALINSTADIIKIMFQDDLFLDENSLLSCIQPILEGHKWSLTSSCHTDQDITGLYAPIITPVYHEKIHHGNNTISSPSVITLKRENMILFDENVSMLLDVDWYKSMRIKNGLPHINNKVNVINRMHKYSLQVNLLKNDKDVVKKELEYIKKKYGEMGV